MKMLPLQKSTTATVASVSLATLTGASALEGAIILNSTQVPPQSGFTVNATISGDTSWNIDGTGNPEMVFSAFVGGSYRYLNLKNFQNGFGLRRNPSSSLLNIGLSAYVNSGAFRVVTMGSILVNGGLSLVAGFTSGETGYLGFKFNPSGSLVLYGWAEVILTGNSFQVVQWAYDDTGADIKSGQTSVPEAETTALGLAGLALGAAGISRWRKGKQAA